MHKCLLDGFSTEKILKHPCRCSEDPDYLRYAPITIVLRYTSHSGDKP